MNTVQLSINEMPIPDSCLRFCDIQCENVLFAFHYRVIREQVVINSCLETAIRVLQRLSFGIRLAAQVLNVQEALVHGLIDL